MAFVAVEWPGKLQENQAKTEPCGLGERRVSYRRVMNVAVLVMASASLAAGRDLALVSNKTNTVNAVTLPDLVKVCKAQTNRWPDGKPVTFIMRAPAVPEMKMFLDKVYGMSGSEVNELVASANHGRANHPAILVVNSDEELVNKVASIPGALGVVDVYSINSSVAVVKLAGKLPLEPGYLLHGN
jgi:ABC-type phosphate transport system substrate-binding protein